MFEKTILQNDRYEWTRRRACLDNAEVKDIFVRDIYKQWYIKGINDRVSDVDKLIEFLRDSVNECEEVITVGNSAGGYMAALIGCKLNADRVFCFSGQFDLSDRIASYPMLLNSLRNQSVAKYFDLTELIRHSDVPIYYFYPALVDQDIWQASRVSDCKNVKAFAFKQKIHGQSMYTQDLPYILSYGNTKLDTLCKQYSGRIITPFTWSLKVSGFFNAIKGSGTLILKRVYVAFRRIMR